MKLHELKDHREALGYQIDRIAELMKIRKNIIETIESPDSTKILSQQDIFFIKRYCDILNVDFNALELSHSIEHGVQPAVNSTPRKSYKKIIKIIFTATLITATTYIVNPFKSNQIDTQPNVIIISDTVNTDMNPDSTSPMSEKKL